MIAPLAFRPKIGHFRRRAIDFRTSGRYDTCCRGNTTLSEANSLAEAPAKAATSEHVYPAATVERLLQAGIREAAEDGADLRSEWEPLLDSLRMVSVLVSLEDLFDFPLPPEKLVKRGGYKSEADAYEHMSGRLRQLWNDLHTSGEGS